MTWKTIMRDSRINGQYRLFHTSTIFSDVSGRATWNDYGVASWNGIRDVQETNEGQTKETRGPTYTFSFPRTRERNGFYVGAPSLRQFGAHTKRWPAVIQKFAGYGGTFTNDEGDFIPSVYLNPGNPRDTVREYILHTHVRKYMPICIDWSLMLTI